MKKRKIYILGLTLILFLGVIEAGIATAEIQKAETSDYDSTNGKKLIFHGEIINRTTIWWRDYSNHSNFESVTEENLSQSVYHFTISEDDTWNASYIEWGAIIVDFWGTIYEFAGGFSTVKPYVDVEDIIDYDRIENISNEMKEDILYVLCKNGSFMQQFEKLGDNIHTSVTDSISTFNEGLVTEMQGMGYSDSQISEMQDLISTGFGDLVRSDREQRLELLKAESDGFWSGVRTIVIFLLVISAIVLLISISRGIIPNPFNKGSSMNFGKKKTPKITTDEFKM